MHVASAWRQSLSDRGGGVGVDNGRAVYGKYFASRVSILSLYYNVYEWEFNKFHIYIYIYISISLVNLLVISVQQCKMG